MVALITLAEAKQHLRVDHTDDDEDIQRKLEEASEIILNYLHEPVASGGGIVVGEGVFADGNQVVALPDWTKLIFTAASGTGVTVESGDLRISLTGSMMLEFAMHVTFAMNKYVILGYGWNGAAVTESGRLQITDTNPVQLFSRSMIDLVEGGLLAIYLSSDFSGQPLVWANGDMTLAQPASSSSAWDPTTAPAAWHAATKLMLEKLYDDRNAGSEDLENVANGYLTPAITALLHRYRTPVLA